MPYFHSILLVPSLERIPGRQNIPNFFGCTSLPDPFQARMVLVRANLWKSYNALENGIFRVNLTALFRNSRF